MTLDEVRRLFSLLDIRERLIAKLTLLAGMRPGEIFGLKWERLGSDYADIQQRVYRGDVDSPKSVRSVRFAALSNGLLSSLDEWRDLSLDARPGAWVFPSEKLTTLWQRTTAGGEVSCQSSNPPDWLGRISRSCGALIALS